MLNLAGHTVVGVGYDESTNPATIHIHDTWDYNNHTMTWGSSYSGMSLLSVSIVNLASLPTYTVSPSSGLNGSISPNTPQTVTSGSTTTFTITPNTGYEVVTPIGGTCPQGSYNASTNIYTTGAIVADCTVAPVFAVFYPLTINLVSTAAGVVNGGGNISGSGISCSSVNGGTKTGTCSGSFSSGSTVTLAAAADANSTFAGWSGGGCSTGGCSFSITADTTVTGSFAGAYKAKISGGSGYDTLTLAHANAGSGATILARELHNATTLAVEPFVENLTITKPVILKGGYNAGFSSNAGLYSTLAGILTIGGTSGALTVENLTIK
ncbi:InlB B-repeat-containing protein [Trichlorobacter lovleyi]|uniref:InlB B-repeat-containing protein n=1 Tax=Trichlorobacter lovleyi TaxID=313985 RepID=UPI00248137DE|nr:hypothetical protein [Trichlorobacter lovleyi]